MPYEKGVPKKCQQFLYKPSNSTNDTCGIDNFERSRTHSCSSFVYKTKERSILQEVGVLVLQKFVNLLVFKMNELISNSLVFQNLNVFVSTLDC